MGIFAKHIELVRKVNESKTQHEYDIAYAVLRGFRAALDEMKINQLIDCDMYYLDQGIDRPMCCGVFLDWIAAECV